MSFSTGFTKTAGEPVAFGAIGGALKKGLSHAGSSTVKGAFNPMTGAKHISEAVKGAGGVGKSFSTQKGREALAEGIGKAAPHIATTGGYLYGAKKVYNKMNESNSSQQGYY
jgi:hypothetical protein